MTAILNDAEPEYRVYQLGLYTYCLSPECFTYRLPSYTPGTMLLGNLPSLKGHTVLLHILPCRLLHITGLHQQDNTGRGTTLTLLNRLLLIKM